MSVATTTPALPIPHSKSRVKAATRTLRELGIVGHALASTHHVVMAQIVPMRFCNLSCAYCNEYDKVSEPVPVDEMLRRIDHLAGLGASIITISGGEPLTHPELDAIIARIRHHRRVAGMITNGYLLVPERIQQLNRAGLDHMQISIDNIEPDEISKKSLKVLDKKLEFLSQHAEFHVNINSVVGGGIRNPQDALVIGNRALALGFTSTIGIIHDGDGQLKPLQDEERRVYYQMAGMAKKNYSRFNKFQEAIANAIRHADPARLAINVEYEDSLVRLKVIDDGRGFLIRGDLLGFGIRGMRKRASEINADFDLMSEPGVGTTIAVSVPIRKRINLLVRFDPANTFRKSIGEI